MRVIYCCLAFAFACNAASGLDEADRRHKWRDASVDTPPSPTPDAPKPVDASSTPGDAAVAGVGPYFSTSMFFNTDVSAAPRSANSASIISTLVSEGGWGNSNVMQVDFELDVLSADNSTPMRSFTPTSDFYSPDCDQASVPVPTGGNIEGETGYSCTTNGDCHLLVYQHDTHQLYEMWRADIKNGTFYGGCLAVWHAAQAYTSSLRGEGCTSADAAGYPISPLLFNADEVAAGHIDHAIRFILPNNRVRPGYTHPATHSTNTTGVAGAPYYGVHLRLRADYPIDSLPTEGAKVVARAMQKYGMYHADGGNIALTAQSDRHTTAKWAGLLGSHDLAALHVSDFEVIDHGASFSGAADCVRTP